MRRWLYLSVLSLALIPVFLFPVLTRNSSEAKVIKSNDPKTNDVKTNDPKPAKPVETKKAARPSSPDKLTITAVPWGPTQADVDAATRAVMRNPTLLRHLRGTSYRKLSFEFINPEDKSSAISTPPNRYRVLIYDYTNNRNVIAEGSFDRSGAIEVSFSQGQPPPSEEEFAAAKYILSRDPTLGPSLRNKKLQTYPPMPPVLYPENENSRVERTVMVGLMSTSAGVVRNEVVGVNMTRNKVVRYEGGAPQTSLAQAGACGITAAGQTSTSNGTAGQYQVTVSQSGTEIWSFLAIRPSASSGATSERSGIELRDVKYRGKMLMKRGHAPILNVKYANNTCGPFRDWQYQEGMFQTEGTINDVTAGFRVCSKATTALESGNDTGNFRGVAVYTEGTETVLVTELNAGWYRYIHEWRLDVDGTIRPRYGYGATNSSCVCAIHYHHTYWRFDLDLGTPEKNLVYEGPLDSFWLQPPLTTEAKFYRNSPNPQSWTIKNATSGEEYRLVAGNDGTAFGDTYGKGDVWFLRYKSSGANPIEIDDPNTDTSANIDAWVNGESLTGGDIVIWYGAHFDHIDGGNISNVRDTHDADVISGAHVVGPDLIPVRW